MLRSLLRILPRRFRVRLVAFFGLMLVAAIFETAGVASILPFMAVVLDPSLIERSNSLRAVMAALGVQTPQGALIAVGILVVAALFLGNASAAGGLWVQQRFVASIRQRLASDLFSGYLNQPYSFHVQRDSASLLKVQFTDVETVLNSALIPLVSAASRVFVVLAMLGLVLLRDATVAAGSLLLVGTSYFLVYRLVSGSQQRLGEESNETALLRQRVAIEGLGSVKELLVLGRTRYFAEAFESVMERYSRAQAMGAFGAMLPKYLLEIVAFGGIVGVTLALVLREGGAQKAIPTLALYAFVGYRIMPSLQQILGTALALRFARPSVASLDHDMAIVRSRSHSSAAATMIVPVPERRDNRGNQEMQFARVRFTYPGAARPALTDISLVVRPHQSLGLVGRTGSGKTTLADLVLGLYEPDEGTITVDGQPLRGDVLRCWRRQVGYVPQSVFLANATVTQNIAFGLPDHLIDQAAVARAARMAQAEEFIAQMPNGYDTLVGERGVKLSGGQRQRLGIARALYDSPSVLVFDEATSALDGMTEEAVMRAIHSLTKDHTLILIAHRLRTVQACDRIVMLEGGKNVADGNYDDLLARSEHFRRLVGDPPAAPSESENPIGDVHV